jgi:hypothetical protein
MIRFSFHLTNPFSKKFKSIFFKHGSLTKNKHWEFEISRNNVLLGFEFSYTMMTDHAGITANLSFFTFEFGFQIYDRRHWNTILNSWSQNEKQRI